MAIEVGQAAPDFTLRDQDNNEWTLSAHRGRNVVLVFYPLDFSATCTTELTELASVADRYDAANAEVVGISVDSRHAHAAFKKAAGLRATLLADFHPKGAIAQSYGVFLDALGFADRATFVIDRDGILRHMVRTSPAQARSQDEYLQALAACPV